MKMWCHFLIIIKQIYFLRTIFHPLMLVIILCTTRFNIQKLYIFSIEYNSMFCIYLRNGTLFSYTTLNNLFW
jgi:hypothetical protein